MTELPSLPCGWSAMVEVETVARSLAPDIVSLVSSICGRGDVACCSCTCMYVRVKTFFDFHVHTEL